MVIGSDLARAMWGDGNPVGRTLASPPLSDLGQQDSITMTVVGVYDATQRLPGMAWGGQAVSGGLQNNVLRVYTARGKYWRRDRILVRTRAPAEPFVTELQRFLRTAAPSLPVTGARTVVRMWSG